MKNTTLLLFFALLLMSCGETKSKSEPSSEPEVVVTRDTVVLGDVSLAITQTRPASPNPEYSCKASLTIFKGDKAVDSLSFEKIQAVGGAYGFSQPVLLENHILLTKHGDYDGRTLIINRSGKLFDMIGGDLFFDQEAGLLFASYDSDMPGIAVFDLKSDALIFEMKEMDIRPETFHKTPEERYVMLTSNDQPAKHSIWEFDWEEDQIVPVELDKTQALNSLVSLPVGNANCTCE